MPREPIDKLVMDSINRVGGGRTDDTEEALLVAEGDSWFDFMAYDAVRKLRFLGYDVECLADAGDTLSDMANNHEQHDWLTRRLLKLKRRRLTPKAILLSAGGNDLVKELQSENGEALLYPAALDQGIVKTNELRKFVYVSLRSDYLQLLRFVTALCSEVFETQARIPIITHGYARPVPDGRYAGIAMFSRGPWLKPVFDHLGHKSLEGNTQAMADTVDEINEMLRTLPNEDGLDHVRYVDVRNCLDNTVEDGKYERNCSPGVCISLKNP